MKLKLLTHLPDKPQSFYDFARSTLGLQEEEVFKLLFISLKIKALSDLPIYKFLERAIPHIKFDEIQKREYLLTLSVYTLREIFFEHFDLKFSKNLYLLLRNKLPKPFLKHCEPKREVIVSQDLFFEYLTKEDLANLPSFLKVKHLIFHFHTEGSCEELLKLIPNLNLFVVKASPNNHYELYYPCSISEFLYYSNVWMKRGIFSGDEIEGILLQLKSLIPECF